MFVNVLPLDILTVSQSFEIGKEIALHLGLVKKAVVFIENGFVALVAQDDHVTRAKKSVANFKLREGMPIGCKVTLRGEKMYEFTDRLVNLALP